MEVRRPVAHQPFVWGPAYTQAGWVWTCNCGAFARSPHRERGEAEETAAAHAREANPLMEVVHLPDPPRSVVLLVMTHGRDAYLERTLASFDEKVTGPIARRVMHDDSANPQRTARLRRAHPDYEVITPQHVAPGRRAGFSASVRNAWAHLASGDEEWVFHLEEDFTFNRPLNLGDLIALSAVKPHLAQVALRRQPWGDEIPHGGFEAMHPGLYVEQKDGPLRWVETTRNFTTNPSLYRRQLTAVGWPDAHASESAFTGVLRRDGLPWGVPGDQVRFGFWGGMEDGRCWVHHIGDDRAGGTGY